MRIKRRSAVVLALAAAGALVTAGVALAAASSTVTLNFTPSNLPTTTFQSGKLGVHTHTNYTNPGNANPGGATQRAQLFFDDDFKINTGATPLCTPSGGDMANAMSECGSSLIGMGTV
jgi:ABC-type transport system substrate-binding protein